MRQLSITPQIVTEAIFLAFQRNRNKKCNIILSKAIYNSLKKTIRNETEITASSIDCITVTEFDW